MCLYTKETEPKIAKKDITVYKLLRKTDNTSPHRKKLYRSREYYRLDTPLNLILGRLNLLWNTVDFGFHAFQHKGAAIARSTRYYDIKVVEMFVPRGAQYIRGDYDEIVSNEIKTGTLEAL